MDMMPLIIQLVSGAAGGNIVGTLFKKLDLGFIGNSFAGILGGGIGGQLLGMLGLDVAGAGTNDVDIGFIVSNVAGGGAGGAVLMAIIGLIRQLMGKKS